MFGVRLSAVTLQSGSGNLNFNAGTILGNATTLNLFNTVATTLNIGGAVGSGGINIGGGSGSTGCTIDGSTGNLTCSGTITGSGSSGVTSLNGLSGTISIANASGSGSTITIDDATVSAKGIASYNSTNFSVTSGAVNLVQNINTGAAPTFAGLTLNGGTLVHATNANAFQVQNAGNANLFNVDTSGNIIQIGSSTSDATAVLLVVDSYNQSTDPTEVDGAMYYNTALNKFRCGVNGAWRDCNSPADLRSSWFLYEEWESANVATACGGSSNRCNFGNLNWRWVAVNSNTNMPTGNANAGNSDEFGAISIPTGTTTTTGSVLTLNNDGMSGIPANMTNDFNFASNTSNANIIVRIGFFNSTTSSSANDSGYWFEFNTTTNGTNWYICSDNEAASATCTSTGIAKAAVGTYQKFRIQTNSAGTSVSFFIDGASAGTISSNLPSTSNKAYGPTILVANNGNSTNKLFSSEYWQLQRTGVSR